jgi:hypothetical protein
LVIKTVANRGGRSNCQSPSVSSQEELLVVLVVDFGDEASRDEAEEEGNAVEDE